MPARLPGSPALRLGLILFTLTATAHAQTVGEAISRMGPCQSHLVEGLSQQVLRSQACMSPDSLVRFSHANIAMNAEVYPYGTPEMVAALYRVADGGAIHINSAFRTVVVQFAYDETDTPGGGDGCFNPASPGTSNHEFGNALDIQNGRAMVSRMTAQGFSWLGESDPVHFNYGAPRRGSGVLAFQRLWNINRPDDRIDEDGAYGPMTRARLIASPAGGFPLDGCDPCITGVGDNDACGIALLLEQAAMYASPTTTDVDGDGRADVCARGSSGVRCWPSEGDGWREEWLALPWSDELGWDDPNNYATIRMGDVNGDGLADVCGRSNTDFRCALSDGSSLQAAAVWQAGLSDEAGWDAPGYYTTIRLADVNGDGRDDLCARDASGFGCWLSNGTAFETRIEGPRWSDEAGFTAAKFYGTLRMGDVDGDGRADACIRSSAGMTCALSDGDGFPTEIAGPEWADASGFGGREYWSTLRMADIDADGRADLCIRTSTDLRCVQSMGESFGEAIVVAALANDSGWADPANYRTIRTGDIDGDGASDLCARGDAGMACWTWNGAGFDAVTGPEWSDASGWGAAPFFETIRLADVDGDGLDDLCARAGDGWRCHPSLGDRFGEAALLGDLDDASGWSAPRYWTTISSGSTTCRPATETCNERDDDCDGIVDESACAPDGGGSFDASGMDGGMTGDAGPSDLASGCSCRASGRGGGPPLILSMLFAFYARRRRREKR